MKFRLIYPRWAKLHQQTEFHLPPHGTVVFAASLPEDVAVDFIDENLQEIDFDDPVDFVGISMMLTIQAKRAWEIADAYRACNPDRPLSAEDDRYVDLSESRGVQHIAELITWRVRNSEPTVQVKQLFTGHRGSGKTTELLRLQKELEASRFDFIRRHFRCDVADPRLYDLVLSTTTFGIDGAVDLICKAVEGVAA